MKHIMQEEKGDPTCLEFLFQHKLYAPAEKEGREACELKWKKIQIIDELRPEI